MSSHQVIRIMAVFLSCCALSAAVGEEPPKRDMKTQKIAVRASRYALKPFGQVEVYRPDGEPRGVVLFLSDAGGWNRTSDAMARTIAGTNMLVAGLSTPALLKAMEQKGNCVDPNYPFIDLARDVQHRMKVRSYKKPVIVGYGAGGTLAFAAIAQWSNASYLGAISMAFTPTLPGRKMWCKAPGFAPRRVVQPTPGWRFGPAKQIKTPWTVLQGRDDKAYTSQQTLQFVSTVPGAKLIELPTVTHEFGASSNWATQLNAAVTAFLPPALPKSAPGQVPIPDMPITLVPAANTGPKDVMAVLYSGDGGWAGIDRDVAGQLAKSGIPVVGIDSLSYFWSARTPKGAGHDLSQAINGFSQRWKRPKVLLIGYSFGADAMPYMIANMDADARAKIVSVSLLGLSANADFQFHLSSWLDMSSDDSLPTIPAIARLKGMRIRCVRGATESESACASIPKGIAQQFLVPGDHHFNRNSALLARIILGQRKPGSVRN